MQVIKLQGAITGFGVGLGTSYLVTEVNWGVVGSSIGDAGRGVLQLFNNRNILLNISIVIPKKGDNTENKFFEIDGKDEDNWHYIVVKDLIEAKSKVNKYLKKKKAETIIVYTHGSPGGINVDDEQNTYQKDLFEKYPDINNKKIKETITSLIGIGNSVEKDGNLIFNSCSVCLSDEGMGLGKGISTLIQNRHLFLTRGLTPGTISLIGGKPVGVIGKILKGFNGQAFLNGQNLGPGRLKIVSSGIISFKFN
jgi:hypothetical protein